MKYFLDTEFLEGTQKRMFGETKPTIDLISIGIVCEDGREYYAISKDFNLKEAWNRYDIEKDFCKPQGLGDKKVYWIRENILKPIFIELRAKEVEEYNIAKRINVVLDFPVYSFCFKEFKRLINKYGKTNKRIAEEIKEFVYTKSFKDNKGNPIIDEKNWIDGKPEFYGYYSDYDWVVFCWLFGKMIDLPKGFPMYCIDLKQLLDEMPNRITRTVFGYRTVEDIKNDPSYPKQINEHNALADARWNKQLYDFLNKL